MEWPLPNKKGVRTMGFFSVEGPFNKFVSRIFDILLLNFLWVLFSLPIITIGASTVAAYSVAIKMVDDKEGYVGRSFVKAFRENLRQGIILGLITIGAAYIVYLNFALFNAIESNPMIILIIGILAGVYFLFSLLYAFPLIARYKNSLLQTLRNSMEISIKYFVRTMMLLLVLALIIFIMFYNFVTMFFSIFVGPAFIILTISTFALNIFQKIEKDHDEAIIPQVKKRRKKQ